MSFFPLAHGVVSQAGAGNPPPPPGFEIAGMTTGGNTSTENPVPVSRPGGIVAGDLQIIILRTGSTVVTHTTPSGWTLLDTRGTTNNRTSVFFRWATGPESGTVSITTSATRTHVWACLRVTGASDIAGAFESFNTANPPNLTPGWTEENIWLGIYTVGRTDNTVTSIPTNYSSVLQVENGAGISNSSGVRIAVAERLLNAASENPAAFGTSGTLVDAHAATVAIRPG